MGVESGQTVMVATENAGIVGKKIGERSYGESGGANWLGRIVWTVT